jgi:hypothetical protein
MNHMIAFVHERIKGHTKTIDSMSGHVKAPINAYNRKVDYTISHTICSQHGVGVARYRFVFTSAVTRRGLRVGVLFRHVIRDAPRIPRFQCQFCITIPIGCLLSRHLRILGEKGILFVAA